MLRCCAEALLLNIVLHNPLGLTQSDTLMGTSLMAQWGPCQFFLRGHQWRVMGAMAHLGWLVDSPADIQDMSYTTCVHCHKCQTNRNKLLDGCVFYPVLVHRNTQEAGGILAELHTHLFLLHFLVHFQKTQPKAQTNRKGAITSLQLSSSMLKVNALSLIRAVTESTNKHT